jgi:hypothetical protein
MPVATANAILLAVPVPFVMPVPFSSALSITFPLPLPLPAGLLHVVVQERRAVQPNRLALLGVFEQGQHVCSGGDRSARRSCRTLPSERHKAALARLLRAFSRLYSLCLRRLLRRRRPVGRRRSSGSWRGRRCRRGLETGKFTLAASKYVAREVVAPLRQRIRGRLHPIWRHTAAPLPLPAQVVVPLHPHGDQLRMTLDRELA